MACSQGDCSIDNDDDDGGDVGDDNNFEGVHKTNFCREVREAVGNFLSDLISHIAPCVNS